MIMGILSAFCSLPAAAGKVEAPARHFFMEVSHSHGRPEWFRIYARGSQWICQTESVPFFKAKANPLAAVDWAALRRQAEFESCEATAKITDARSKPVKSAKGCVDRDPAWAGLLERLNAACRAS